tara:strand:- start:532 stop:1329 length:798 start_codon:yes stop_codon:yes gene_type:complete
MIDKVKYNCFFSTGVVRHERFKPTKNTFSHKTFSFFLPLRSLKNSNLPSIICSRNNFNLISFYDSDHGDGKTPLLIWIDKLLHSNNILDANGEIWLYTFPRVFGYVFKPVSFWFCHKINGDLRAVLCEVNNTFGERHFYLLDDEKKINLGKIVTAKKAFHVSPFCKIEGEYKFRFLRKKKYSKNRSVEKILCIINYEDSNGILLKTSISGLLEKISNPSAIKVFFWYPILTFRIIFEIHWQAVKLFFKKVPYFNKPSPPSKNVTR